MKPEVIFKGIAFPESLRWRGGDLWFSDVLAGVVYRGEIETGQLNTEAKIQPLVSGLGWLNNGDLLAVDCDKKAVLRQELNGELTIYSDFSSHWEFNSNDMLVDSDDTVWVGTYGFDPEGDTPVPADLARVTDGVIDFPISGLVFANGIARIDDDRIVVAESFADRISIIQTNGGVRLLKQIQLAAGTTPDGLVVDNQGFAWVAAAYGEAILRVNLETNEVVRAIEIPGRGVYDCTFGGKNLDKLFVATSDVDETHALWDLPGEILCFDLTLEYPGIQGMGNK
jgi:sugar lactone lactonase YvrE